MAQTPEFVRSNTSDDDYLLTGQPDQFARELDAESCVDDAGVSLVLRDLGFDGMIPAESALPTATEERIQKLERNVHYLMHWSV